MTPEENEALLRTIESVSTVAAGGVLAVFFTHKLTMSISTFIHEAAIIKFDVPRRKRPDFENLCRAITDIEHPTVYGPSDRENATKMIKGAQLG